VAGVGNRRPAGGNGTWKLLAFVVPVIMTIINLGVATWLGGQIVDREKMEKEIQANRLEISTMRLELATKSAKAEVPTQEVLRWLERHDKEIEDLRHPKK
jgi:hypothetical protein